MPDNNSYVKILFKFYSNILDEETAETMWAEIIDKEKGLYKLDNIPFYAQSVASDDIIYAEYDKEEQMLTYRETIEYSGNSTIHVIILDKTIDKENVRKVFEDLGCESEGLNEHYFAIDVPICINYLTIRNKLDELSAKEIISFAESCLSEVHRK